jgi:NAD(P)-dependent dehydrogenase (short-subunit alcohol dehydrogenase family)
MTRLDGRVAVVTGASRGIGAATVRALRASGATVLAVARPPFGADPDPDPGVRRLGVDVSDWAQVEGVLGAALNEVGPVDVLVNAAGIPGRRMRIADLPPENMWASLAVNALGSFHTMKLVLASMEQRQHGVVVNIVSGAADRPRPGRSMYGTGKSALEHLTRVAAAEMSPAGVRVYAFHPGMVDTELFRSTRTSPEGLAEIERARVAGDLQTPSMPGAAIAFLASDDAADLQDVVVPWRERAYREELAARPDFADPEPVPVA